MNEQLKRLRKEAAHFSKSGKLNSLSRLTRLLRLQHASGLAAPNPVFPQPSPAHESARIYANGRTRIHDGVQVEIVKDLELKLTFPGQRRMTKTLVDHFPGEPVDGWINRFRAWEWPGGCWILLRLDSYRSRFMAAKTMGHARDVRRYCTRNSVRP